MICVLTVHDGGASSSQLPRSNPNLQRTKTLVRQRVRFAIHGSPQPSLCNRALVTQGVPASVCDAPAFETQTSSVGPASVLYPTTPQPTSTQLFALADARFRAGQGGNPDAVSLPGTQVIDISESCRPAALPFSHDPGCEPVPFPALISEMVIWVQVTGAGLSLQKMSERRSASTPVDTAQS